MHPGHPYEDEMSNMVGRITQNVTSLWPMAPKENVTEKQKANETTNILVYNVTTTASLQQNDSFVVPDIRQQYIANNTMLNIVQKNVVNSSVPNTNQRNIVNSTVSNRIQQNSSIAKRADVLCE